MSNYFSPASGLFYSALIFGERRIMVPDPSWVRPLVERTIQHLLAEGDDPSVIAAEYDDSVTNWEVADGHLLITIREPDDGAEPPMVEIDNPACRLPPDAVPVDGQRYRELQIAQSVGKLIGQDDQGNPVALEPPLPSLTERKARITASITAERDRREAAGFPYQGKVMDSTPLSVQRITAAALAAQVALAAGQPFSLDWTCADNSALTLDAAGIIGMPVALAQHAATLHAHARNLKAAVAAAVDQAGLDVIDIQAGWSGGMVV